MLFLLRQRYSQDGAGHRTLYKKDELLSSVYVCVEARDEYANHFECLFEIKNNIKELQEKSSYFYRSRRALTARPSF